MSNMNNITDIFDTSNTVIPHKPSQVEMEKINIQKQIEKSDISILHDLFSGVHTNIIQETKTQTRGIKARTAQHVIKSSKNNNSHEK